MLHITWVSLQVIEVLASAVLLLELHIHVSTPSLVCVCVRVLVPPPPPDSPFEIGSCYAVQAGWKLDS